MGYDGPAPTSYSGVRRFLLHTLSGFLGESGKLIGYVLPGLDFPPFLPPTPENTKWQEDGLPHFLSGLYRRGETYVRGILRRQCDQII